MQPWLDYLSKCGTTEQWNKIKYSTVKSKKPLENSAKGSKMKVERGMANGNRTSRRYVLTEEDIASVISEAEAISIPKEMLKFNYGIRTGYVEYSDSIHIKGDILPDETSTIARDRMSIRAVLAHEYYGHRANTPSEYDVDDWRDEFRASYDAAVNAPNLTERDRADLMIDAYDRARENNEFMEYDEIARGIIYGY